MVFNIKSSIIAVTFMASSIFALAGGKIVGISIIETIKGNAKEYHVTAYAHATTGESCTVSCSHTDANPCKAVATDSSQNHYTCRISSFKPNSVGIEVVDKVNTYKFNGVHYYDTRNIRKEVSTPEKIRYEKYDFWPGA